MLNNQLWGTVLVPTRLAIQKKVLKLWDEALFIRLETKYGVRVIRYNKVTVEGYSTKFWKPKYGDK